VRPFKRIERRSRNLNLWEKTAAIMRMPNYAGRLTIYKIGFVSMSYLVPITSLQEKTISIRT
jgi:hypothetical protein